MGLSAMRNLFRRLTGPFCALPDKDGREAREARTIVGVELPGTLEALELRVRTMLPEQYQDRYEDVLPVSMGSASLKYDQNGKVAWGDIWGSFCDLAMAGGPPHKGTLLEPGTPEEIAANPEGYAEVVKEICRGIRLATGLVAKRSAAPGWVAVDCQDETSSDWLVRAIAMENVSTFRAGAMIHLPAGPAYRVAKEVKNVVTSIAKTAHYWLDHTPIPQQSEIGDLLLQMDETLPLFEPALRGGGLTPEAHYALCKRIGERVERETKLRLATDRYLGWCGLTCSDAATAIWMMRALVASNVLARREEATLFAPVNPIRDPDGARIADLVIEVHRLATKRAASSPTTSVIS